MPYSTLPELPDFDIEFEDHYIDDRLPWDDDDMVPLDDDDYHTDEEDREDPYPYDTDYYEL